MASSRGIESFDKLANAVARLEANSDTKYKVEIRDSSKVGAEANAASGTIIVSSAAAESLSEEALAFIVAHEQAHLDRTHVDSFNEVTTKVIEGVANALNQKDKGAVRRVAEPVFVGVAGAVASSTIRQMAELDADGQAKGAMQRAHFSADEIGRVFDRLPEGGDFSHPSTSTRRKAIE